MNSDHDFKALWKEQKVSAIPDSKEIIEKAAQLKRSTRNKMIFGNVLLLVTAAFILYIWFIYQPQMLTTKIGIVLIISAIICYVIASNRVIFSLHKSNLETDSSNYLTGLLKLKQQQNFIQRTMTNIYFILLSSGIFLYMIEYTMRMKTGWAIVAYCITLAWIALNWFYMRPRAIRKQQLELNELIDKLKAVNQELSNNP